MVSQIVIALALVVPSVEGVAAAVLEHFQKYIGLEFEYSSKVEHGTDGKFEKRSSGIVITQKATSDTTLRVDSTSILRLWNSGEEDDTRVRRVWIEKERSAKDGSISNFVAFDGSSTRIFRHAAPGKLWNQANIVPWEDTELFEKNFFDGLLHLNAFGVPTLSADTPSPMEWTIAGPANELGMVVYELSGDREGWPYRFDIVVSEAPNALVVSSIVTNKKDGAVHEQYGLEQVGEFEGILYPAKGKYSRAPSGAAGSRLYEFVVNSVKRLPGSENLTPEFPSGTAVMDQLSGKNYSIPHEKDSYDRAESALLVGSVDSKPRTNWLLLVNLAVVFLIAVTWIVRKWRRIG